jgi:hypothetical protein
MRFLLLSFFLFIPFSVSAVTWDKTCNQNDETCLSIQQGIDVLESQNQQIIDLLDQINIASSETNTLLSGGITVNTTTDFQPLISELDIDNEDYYNFWSPVIGLLYYLSVILLVTFVFYIFYRIFVWVMF